MQPKQEVLRFDFTENVDTASPEAPPFAVEEWLEADKQRFALEENEDKLARKTLA